MRFRLKDKPFAEKMADKKELSKRYGKIALKLYKAISAQETIEEEELRKVLNELGLPEETLDFLLNRGILEKEVEEAAVAQQPVKEEPPLLEQPQQEISQPEPLKELQSKSEEIPFEPIKEEELPAPSSEQPDIELDISPELPEEATSAKEEIAKGTPVERTVMRKYGEDGVKVLRYTQEGKTIKEIAELTNLPIETVVEIVDFLRAMGLVGAEEEPKFTPLIERAEKEIAEEMEAPIEDELEAYKYIGSGGLEKYTVGLDLALKYGKEGRIVFEHMLDKVEKDVVEIALQLDVPIEVIKDVMNYLASKKLVKKNTVSRYDVREKYGYDAFALYKRFGTKGVLFYRMMGGDYSTKEAVKRFAKLSGEKDPEKILEILNAIYSFLGLSLPITRETIIEILQGD